MEIFLTYILPIIVMVAAAAVITIFTTKHVKDKLSLIETGGDILEGALEFTDHFVDNDVFTKVKEIIIEVVYSVEEIAKTEKMTSEEKTEKAYEFFVEIAEKTGIDTSAFSKDIIVALIKGAVYIMNKEYNGK